MKWRLWRSKEYASSYADAYVKEHVEAAWGVGFNEAIEHAASLVTQISPHSGQQLAILIRGIGTAQVGEDGKRVERD